MSYAKTLKQATQNTPVTCSIAGREAEMVVNSTGGYTFKLDDWGYLDRFLILGSDRPTYYTSAKKLTEAAATNVIKLIKQDAITVVNRIVEISNGGRAPKNDPAIFALALTSIYADEAGRKAAYDALPKVCRIGTHLFQFVETVNQLGKWNAVAKRGISAWYNKKELDKVVFQMLKYQSRDGWSHRDVLRLAHVKPDTEERSNAYRWAVTKEVTETSPKIVRVFSELHANPTVKNAIIAIENDGLTWEMLPTQLLRNSQIWEKLIEKIGYTALLRNLGRMSSIGMLGSLSDASKTVINLLSDTELLKRSRIHPINVLAALKTYSSGRSVKGSLTWQPNQRIVSALDAAFYEAFKNVEPTGKNFLLGIDCSGSMFNTHVYGLDNITAAEAATVIAMAIMKTEKNYVICGFSTGFSELNIHDRMSLNEAMEVVRRFNWSSTNLAAPVDYAIANKLPVDCFVSITDNEVNRGCHPRQALEQFRGSFNKEARYVICGTTVTNFSVADPTDSHSLDIVGFDSAVPQLISNFATGKL
jgi:60 kDa SS-A/Ro ribonucleoprotein